MSINNSSSEKITAPLFSALYNFEPRKTQKLLSEIIHPSAFCHYFHPIGDLEAFLIYERIYAPLFYSFPDFERRETIRISGKDAHGEYWIGNAGYFLGTFVNPFLTIPPTGHLAHIRFHEFYKCTDGKVSEIQAIWDIPSLMMQANVWPMGPSLGREWLVPSPATQDGIKCNESNEQEGEKNKLIVLEMLSAMSKHPKYGDEKIMELEKFWHPKFNWYGPSGIGSSRGVLSFRKFHQIPFLRAMPDRGQYPEETTHHFFSEENYVAVTGWPNMSQTLTGDGWLGIAPTNHKITLRSLDFWRLEKNKIRENWVMIDLLDIWAQIDVNVISRMQELAFPRTNLGQVTLSEVQ